MIAMRLTYIASGGALGLVLPFLWVVLQARGFDAGAIGFVSAAAGLSYALAVPVWGHVGDVTLGRARGFQVSAIGAALALIGLGLPLPGVILGAMVVAFIAFESAFSPLGDSLAISILADPSRQYGRIRWLQSLAFAVVAIVAGFVYNLVGYGWLPVLWAAGAALTALALVPLARIPQRREVHLAGRRGGSIRAALSIQPRLPRILIAIAAVYVGIAASSTFLVLRIVALGGQPSDVALVHGVAALTEAPGMLLASWLARRIGLRALFCLGALAYVICMVGWSVLDSPFAIIATRVLSGVGFAALWFACVLTMSVLLPARLQSSGQALYQLIAAGIAGVLANAIGGLVYQQIGAGLFLIAAVVTFIGAILAWLCLPDRTESRAGLVAPADPTITEPSPAGAPVTVTGSPDTA
jgi:PPP family 3-phenylpropionic acid transporter